MASKLLKYHVPNDKKRIKYLDSKKIFHFEKISFSVQMLKRIFSSKTILNAETHFYKA